MSSSQKQVSQNILSETDPYGLTGSKSKGAKLQGVISNIFWNVLSEVDAELPSSLLMELIPDMADKSIDEIIPNITSMLKESSTVLSAALEDEEFRKTLGDSMKVYLQVADEAIKLSEPELQQFQEEWALIINRAAKKSSIAAANTAIDMAGAAASTIPFFGAVFEFLTAVGGAVNTVTYGGVVPTIDGVAHTVATVNNINTKMHKEMGDRLSLVQQQTDDLVNAAHKAAARGTAAFADASTAAAAQGTAALAKANKAASSLTQGATDAQTAVLAKADKAASSLTQGATDAHTAVLAKANKAASAASTFSNLGGGKKKKRKQAAKTMKRIHRTIKAFMNTTSSKTRRLRKKRTSRKR